MKRILLAIVALLTGFVTTVGLAAVPVMADSIEPFIALLNSGQEVSRPSSNALGVAFMTFDEETAMLCYSISFTTLVAPEIAAHFHSPAAPGVNAAVRFPISPSPSPLGSPKTGCVGPLNEQDEGNLKDGLFYINVHSTAFPTGEIRGQVLPIKGTDFD